MFLLTLPLAVVAVVMAWRLVPSHVNESTGAVDNWGGILSVVLVGSHYCPPPDVRRSVINPMSSIPAERSSSRALITSL